MGCTWNPWWNCGGWDTEPVEFWHGGENGNPWYGRREECGGKYLVKDIRKMKLFHFESYQMETTWKFPSI